MFKTNDYNDRLTINGIEYFENAKVNQIVPQNFIIQFISDYNGTDEGFILNWSCTEWGEWTQVTDGTCDYERRPIINGTNVVGELDQKSNSTCSK